MSLFNPSFNIGSLVLLKPTGPHNQSIERSRQPVQHLKGGFSPGIPLSADQTIFGRNDALRFSVGELSRKRAELHPWRKQCAGAAWRQALSRSESPQLAKKPFHRADRGRLPDHSSANRSLRSSAELTDYAARLI
jgi:hypothetical protein